MNKSLIVAASAAAFLFTAQAYADDTTSPLPSPQQGVDSNAPLAGANSFTETQVKERLESNGFAQVAGLKLDEQGIWRGQATHEGKPFQIAVDYRGNITYSGTIAAQDGKS